jgi:hypothetical protein
LGSRVGVEGVVAEERVCAFVAGIFARMGLKSSRGRLKSAQVAGVDLEAV